MSLRERFQPLGRLLRQLSISIEWCAFSEARNQSPMLEVNAEDTRSCIALPKLRVR